MAVSRAALPSMSGRADAGLLAHDGVYQVTACETCRHYLKALDVRRAGRPFFLALDTVATIPLDQAVVE